MKGALYGSQKNLYDGSGYYGKISECDPDDIAVLQIDPEGNGFRPIQGVDNSCRYHDGDIGLRELDNDLAEMGYSDEDVMTTGLDCVVIYP